MLNEKVHVLVFINHPSVFSCACAVDNGGLFSGSKAKDPDADYSFSSSKEVKNSRCYTSTPSSWLNGAERDKFTFHFYNEAVIPYYRVGQRQHTGGPHNSLRARLRAARVYTYIEKVGGTELNKMPLVTNSKLR